MSEVGGVAITGIGLITPLGVGVQQTWDGLVNGRSAVGPITAYDASSLRSSLGAEIHDLEPKEFVSNRRSLRTMTRYDMLATVAAVAAVRDAGLELDGDPEGRTALFVASNKEISEPEKFEDAALATRDEHGQTDVLSLGAQAASVVPPLFYIEGLQAAALFYISDALALMGANTYFAGTAEAGLNAIGRAFRAIRRGEADIAIAGGADVPTSWWNMAQADSLGILSTRNQLLAGACAPFDRDRDGTVFGEGGAYLVLEDSSAATARGARIYAEVVGFGGANDTEHLLTPDPDGRAVAKAIESALKEAGAGPADVGYVAAHGSGVKHEDASEARALHSVLGSPVASSVKPATGNLVAAAGALNAAVAALALSDGVLPPTLNLHNVDPDCEGVDWNAGEAREASVSLALALARGLEGQNVALALRAV